MGRYLVRRLLQIVPMLLGIATLVFFLVNLTPGGPVVALAGEFVTAETQAAIERLYGLDRPLLERYLRFLGLLLQGELGQSYGFKAPVLDVVLERVPATLLLMVPAIALSAMLGVACGALAARRRGTFGEATVITCTLVCYAIPIFWLGQLLLFAFSIKAGWFPTHGMVDLRAGHEGLRLWLDVAHHAVLPCLTLTLHQLAFTVLISRASLFAEMQRPYFTTALAKGLSLRRAQDAHALPNGILPVVTLIGNRVGWLIAGAVLVENVFAWPGLGRLIVSATSSRRSSRARAPRGPHDPSESGPRHQTVAGAILTEAGLSYLGLADPNVVSWGRLIENAQAFLYRAWWLSVFPGIAIVLTIVAITLVMDGLRREWRLIPGGH